MNNSIIMSIKDIHMKRIISQEKNHEFRTKIPKNKVDYIIVYVPSPIKELKYIIKVSKQICTPNRIRIAGYGNEKFNQSPELKYAYPIEHLFELNKSISLKELKEEFAFYAPQSFIYGNSNLKLLNYINEIGYKKIY